MQQGLEKEFVRNNDNISTLFTDEGMTTVLNNVFEITKSVNLSDDQLFNKAVIESLVYELTVSLPFLQKYHILQNKEAGGYFPLENKTILVPSRDFDEDFEKYASILSMIPKASEDIELDLYELHRRNKNDKLFKTKYFSKILNTNTYFSDEYEHFEKKMLDYIIVRLIGIKNIQNIYTAFSKYISKEIINKIKTDDNAFNMDLEFDMALSFEYPKKTPLDVKKELEKARTKINDFADKIESQYKFDYMFYDYPENKQQLEKLLEECVAQCQTKFPSTIVNVDGYDTDTQSQEDTILYIGVIDEVYKLLLTKLSEDKTLNKYVKQLSPLTQVNQTLSIKEQLSEQPTATQPTAENNYTFNVDTFEKLYYNVYKGGVIFLKEIVVIDMTELQNFYYYVLVLFLFKKDLDYQLPKIEYPKKSIVTISELKRALYETGEKIRTPGSRAKILTQYFECFKTYVFNKDNKENQHIYLGLGGYLISMLCMPYVPLEHYIFAQSSKQLFQDLKKFISIDNFDTTITHVKDNINKIIGDTYVKCFTQNPYMLGFFTFISTDLSIGTCQDDALLKMMDDEKKDKLYGMQISSYPHLSHWENIKISTEGNLLGEEGSDYNDIIITGNNTVMHSASVGTRAVFQGKKFEDDHIINRKTKLTRADIKKIAKDSYQDRANIFLGMTLAHVYRHSIKKDDTTAYSIENRKLNGVAFKKTQDESFEDAVLKYITNYITIPSSFGNSITTESKTRQFDFTKIQPIFNRDFVEIMKKVRPTNLAYAPFGGGNKQNKKANTKYEKYGKLHNRIVYKKKNTYYFKVKKNNAFVYKRLPCKSTNGTFSDYIIEKLEKN